MSAMLRVTRPTEAETVWVVRDRLRFMGALDGTNLCVFEVEVPPGSATPPHIHDSPEIFRVTSGELTFGRFGGGPPLMQKAPAGTVVTVPSRLPHNYANEGPGPASMLVIAERSMDAFFRDLGRTSAPPAAPPSAEEIAEIMAACARHGIELLGGGSPAARPDGVVR